MMSLLANQHADVTGGEFLRPIGPTIFGDGCQLLCHILNDVTDG